jgi:His-Xaa-Ser system protein HxsD
MNVNSVRDGEIIAYIDAAMFSKETVLKALYWFGDKFHTNIRLEQGTTFIITLKPLPSINMKEEELVQYLQKLERDIIDFDLRASINAETQNIRELLVAKAFSNGEFDEAPVGEISDAVGFDPVLDNVG